MRSENEASPAAATAANSFDKDAAGRGQQVFDWKAKCSMWYVPPPFPEPGWNAHKPERIGIDDFQVSRSPNMKYRTTPLRLSLRGRRADSITMGALPRCGT